MGPGYWRSRHASLFVVAILSAAIGCGGSKPNSPHVGAYDPTTFRADLNSLIDAREYGRAVAYLESADPARQAEHDKTGYLAVGEILIVLPGVDPKIDYDRGRDWFMPGTQDAIEDMSWQLAATEFARRYNEVRASE